ncbi:MAG: hypothetical protein JO170_23205 [Verrucomicrobia bacterium]|nr:hypothetical protein [Verrucomicrobiota bacterium]
MAKDFSLKSFSNFRSTTVQNPLELETALQQLSELIAMPHFKTKRGKAFAFDEIEDALRYVGSNGEKPILRPA